MKRKIVADLHVHTNHSDGVNSPQEIVQMAIESKLQAIAISDHDTFFGIQPAIEAAGDKLTIIPAIEFSSEIENHDLHILGYFIDINNPLIKAEVKKYREVRDTRARKIVEKMNKMGIDIDYSEIEKIAGSGVAVGRPHIARAMIEHGVVSSMGEAFRQYLHDGSPYYVPKYKIHPNDAIKLIHDAGGVPVWAHPGTLDCDHFLEDFIAHGLKGIEVFHPLHNRSTTDHYLTLAKRYDLLITGGSDFHGKDMGRVDLGSCGIVKNELETLLNKAKSNTCND